MKKYIKLAACLLIFLLLVPASGAFADTSALLTGGQDDTPSQEQPGGTSAGSYGLPSSDSSGLLSSGSNDVPGSGSADSQSSSGLSGISSAGSAAAAASQSAAGMKYIVLTFDDGPNSSNTPKLLDMLAEYHVHATFFVVGSRIKGNEQLLVRMVNEGHEIGNHSWNHKRYTSLNNAALKNQLLDTNRLIYEACGVTAALARPPYGARNARVLGVFKELGFSCVLWSIDPEDWNTSNAKAVCAHVTARAQNGSIILLHDRKRTSVAAAEMMIQKLTAEGYTFVTVSELLGGKLTEGSVYRHA